ncbi:MAG: hypothetical protein M3O88_00870, partial [Actinomycetota bacterium]|nr:hypothetical protein [Actinomycetota bacterium]
MEGRSWHASFALGILSLTFLAWAVPSAVAAGRAPVARRIVFESDRAGGFEIFTAKGDGSDVRQVT